MSTTLDLSLSLWAIAQVLLGSLLGAAAALAMQKARSTRFALAVFNVAVCAAAGVLTMSVLRWPHVSMLFALGLVAAAAPLTLALTPAPPVRTVSEAVDYAKRAGAALTMHILYSVGSATAGFVVSLLILALAST